MIYACILFCALIVPIEYTVKAQQYFTDQGNNEESKGEVISIKHSIHKRGLPELTLYLNKGGYNKKVILQSAEGFFAGKNTKVWVAKKTGNNFTYFPQNNIMDKVNLTFYHDQETKSVIAHTVNEEGVSEFNDFGECMFQCTREGFFGILRFLKICLFERNLTAEDGYPCGNHKHCFNGECVVFKLTPNTNKTSINLGTDIFSYMKEEKLKLT
ncbi:uncharacterized protein LOC122507456 [Leptopilina heterotoma]|uniref:uncharacterized protein LOC122507456 n=1 Tax=Leptopilina heterotoma TaxID=63436 RepID=UPI001CA8B707|nr:uncharacterized protein LOC122507456 [Leptopilina heterotoma]XP_043476108.1 uncharacterized protein LOC122507456 [Leptopilina heterotoma]